jgi:hypothetical protein
MIEEVVASLSSGGLFVYADMTVAADPSLERAFQEASTLSELRALAGPSRR